jgi:hypothetical protein
MPVTLGETMKPGETLTSRDNRFAVWTQHTGFNRKASNPQGSYRTDFKISTTWNQDDARRSFDLGRSMRDRNSSQVSKLKGIQNTNSLSKSTTNMETFGDVTQRIRTKIRPADDFREVFEAHAIPTPDGKSTMLALNRVARVVKGVLGDDTAEYIVDKFTKLSHKITVSRYITWEQFR